MRYLVFGYFDFLKDCPAEWPESLKSFVQICNNLIVEEDDSLLSHHNLSDVESRKRNWPKKKLDEVFHLSHFVGTHCQAHHCDLIIDIGSGLV